jgi:CBS-domain-containing membrane protein
MRASHSAASHSFVTGIMRRDIQPIGLDDDLFEVQQRLNASQLEALPVAVNSRFLGMITQHQIAETHLLLRKTPNASLQSQSV